MERVAPKVFVIDPDDAVRAAVREVARGMNLACEAYASGREFFAADHGSLPGGLTPGCLVSEVRIPDMSGFQIQRRLASMEWPLPIIFLTAYDDLSMAVTLMRGGAVHYLLKPLRPLDLFKAVQESLARDRSCRRTARRWQRMREAIARLTAKEREVVFMIAKGRKNQAIAHQLGVSLRTVELRRANLSVKLNLRCPAALLRFAMLASRHGTAFLSRSARKNAAEVNACLASHGRPSPTLAAEPGMQNRSLRPAGGLLVSLG